MIKWISIRNKWPDNPGRYWVKDCRENVEGWCDYDGFDWGEPEYNLPKKGSLLLVFYTVTHWAENKST